MNIDQAIFTSAETVMGQGYRVTAASPGVTSDEKKCISRHSPSHEALCDKSADAVGLAFYRMDSGRYVLARTCYAGQEQSGRGGKRVLTRVFVLTSDQCAAFRWNPFDILRAASVHIDPTRSVQRSGCELETVSLRGPLPDGRGSVVGDSDGYAGDVEISRGVAAIHDGRHVVSEAVYLYLLDVGIGGSCVVVNELPRAHAVLESILLAMPVSKRRQFEFSIGLRIALSRRYQFHCIDGDTKSVTRIVRGHDIKFIDDVTALSKAGASRSRWTELVADCFQSQCLTDLVELCTRHCTSDVDDALDGLVSRQMVINHLPERTLSALVGLVRESRADGCEPDGAIERDGANITERWLESRLHNKARATLLNRLAQSTPTDIRGVWDDLITLTDDADIAEFCTRFADDENIGEHGLIRPQVTTTT